MTTLEIPHESTNRITLTNESPRVGYTDLRGFTFLALQKNDVARINILAGDLPQKFFNRVCLEKTGKLDATVL